MTMLARGLHRNENLGPLMEAVMEHFDSSSQLPLTWIAAAMLLLAAILVGLRLRRWWKHRNETPSPMLTFKRIADTL